MAIGDLCTVEGDAEFAGFRFTRRPASLSGQVPEGTIYSDDDTEWEGWDLPESRDTDQPTDGDGDFYGAERLQARVVRVSGLLVSGRATMLSLRSAMLRTSVVDELCMQGMGPAPTTSSKLFAYARPREFSYVEDGTAHTHELYRVDCEWKCGDPYLYGATENQVTVDGTNPEVPNDGNQPAPWRATVAGLCVGPRFRRMDDSTEYLIDFGNATFGGLTIPNGQTLSLSIRQETAVVNGVSKMAYARNANNLLAPLWRIPVGGEAVGFASDSGTSSATLYVRDTYL